MMTKSDLPLEFISNFYHKKAFSVSVDPKNTIQEKVSAFIFGFKLKTRRFLFKITLKILNFLNAEVLISKSILSELEKNLLLNLKIIIGLI